MVWFPFVKKRSKTFYSCGLICLAMVLSATRTYASESAVVGPRHSLSECTTEIIRRVRKRTGDFMSGWADFIMRRRLEGDPFPLVTVPLSSSNLRDFDGPVPGDMIDKQVLVWNISRFLHENAPGEIGELLRKVVGIIDTRSNGPYFGNTDAIRFAEQRIAEEFLPDRVRYRAIEGNSTSMRLSVPRSSEFRDRFGTRWAADNCYHNSLLGVEGFSPQLGLSYGGQYLACFTDAGEDGQETPVPYRIILARSSVGYSLKIISPSILDANSLEEDLKPVLGKPMAQARRWATSINTTPTQDGLRYLETALELFARSLGEPRPARRVQEFVSIERKKIDDVVQTSVFNTGKKNGWIKLPLKEFFVLHGYLLLRIKSEWNISYLQVGNSTETTVYFSPYAPLIIEMVPLSFTADHVNRLPFEESVSQLQLDHAMFRFRESLIQSAEHAKTIR